MVLTGLNMGGKSSLSRSVALIALLAQVRFALPSYLLSLSDVSITDRFLRPRRVLHLLSLRQHHDSVRLPSSSLLFFP
jgi:hypothetical protein